MDTWMEVCSLWAGPFPLAFPTFSLFPALWRTLWLRALNDGTNGFLVFGLQLLGFKACATASQQH